MSAAMDFLDELSKLSPEEFRKRHTHDWVDEDGKVKKLFGYPATEEMRVDANLTSRQSINFTFDFDTYFDIDTGNLAIFRSSGTSGSGGTNTTNGNQLTWTWPTGAGNTVTPSPSATPVVTQTLYRRSTHDENGDAKQFTKEQEQMWRDLAAIATMTSPYIWKTAQEIYRDAEDYQKRMRTTGVYIALSTVETSLAVLVVNGMVEVKNA